MTKEIERHHQRLREMGCIVTGRTDRVTIHHCHSGSMVERGVTRGGGQKTSAWLVIPLDLYLHSMGPEAIDGAKGVLSWEAQYGRQADFIDLLCERLAVDLWRKAQEQERVTRRSRPLRKRVPRPALETGGSPWRG